VSTVIVLHRRKELTTVKDDEQAMCGVTILLVRHQFEHGQAALA